MAPPTLARISTDDLHRELSRRAEQIAKLESERNGLVKRLTEVDAELKVLVGSIQTTHSPSIRRRSRSASHRGGSSPAARTRAQNKLTLAEALRKALKGKTMGVTEAAKAVQKAGYKTHANSFPTVVNITLLKRKDLFSKKGRGRYTAA